MAHGNTKHQREQPNKTETEQRDQYFEDRRFIAKFLENNLKGPQAAKVLRRFWWYRCEENEIEVVMGRKREYNRPHRLLINDEDGE